MVRVKLTEKKTIFKNEIIEVIENKKLVGSYRKIIKKLYKKNIRTILMAEYNEKIIKYAKRFGVEIEDEFEVIPNKIKNIIKSMFEEKGGLSVGIIFYKNVELAKKIAKEILDFVRILHMQEFYNSKSFANEIFFEKGLQIIFEKDIEKIKRKNIIVIDINDNININNRVII